MLRTLLAATAALFVFSPVAAQNATVSVLHGIPGLPEPVEVFADNGLLFAFDFGELQGPLSLPPGQYLLEVRLQGNTVLSLNADLAADTNYTVVAHLEEGGGLALNAFVNDVSSVQSGESRLIARHLADAPPVDVIARRFFQQPQVLFGNVSNGGEGQADVPSRFYRVSLNAAGQSATAFGPESFWLRSETIYAVYAIGILGDPSFQLFRQVLDPAASTGLVATTGGTACGGAIGISNATPGFGEDFDVTLTGAAADEFGILHVGFSDSRFLLFSLPLELDLLGATGCSLYQSTEIVIPTPTDANGEASRTLSVPTSAALWFGELNFQYSFAAPGANPLGYQLSDYINLRGN